MSAHTPGPWESGDRSVTGGKFVLIHSGRRLVARAHGNTYAEAEANGRLITAAPDLLAALDGLLAYPMDPDWEVQVNAAREAIAKARA